MTAALLLVAAALLLAFGALMMVLMIVRPEGLWPERAGLTRKKPKEEAPVSAVPTKSTAET